VVHVENVFDDAEGLANAVQGASPEQLRKLWFAAANEYQQHDPGLHHLSEWLEYESHYGPLVPPRPITTASWRNRKFGLQFPLQHSELDSYSEMPVDHVLRRQEPAELKELIYGERLLELPNDIANNVATGLLHVGYSTACYKHLGISPLPESQSLALTGASAA